MQNMTRLTVQRYNNGGEGMKKLTTRKQYDEVKARVESLIAEATTKGMLEPNMDNEYTQ